ncbi:MAG: hypothetical protein AAF591_18250 [Verrucomicrobiota bacterium]
MFLTTALFPADLSAASHSYRAEFQGTTFPPNWQYLWNRDGPITDHPSTFIPLEWDSGTAWDTDASNPGRPDPAPGFQLRFTPNGGHPGNANPDRYAIACYTLTGTDGAGHYAITNSFLTLTHSGGSADGVEVRVFTDNGNEVTTWLSKTVQAFSTIDFNIDIGFLEPGDSIYVGFGENGSHARDLFVHDFTIETVPAPTPPDLSLLNQFAEDFPRAFFFRREPAATQLEYLDWKNNNFGRLNGCLMKGLFEEVITLSPQIFPYLNNLATEEPDQFAILHMNGIAGDPTLYGPSFYPGHWLYLPGSGISTNINPGDSIINVVDGSVFRENIGRQNSRNDEIVIVPTILGVPDWANAEHASITSILGNQLTVTRNFHGLYTGSPQTFIAGQTYVAPHAYSGPFGITSDNNMLWVYNFSDQCPLDASGKNAGEIVTDFLAEKFAPGGQLARFAGLQFDIARRELQNFNGRFADINNDAIGDRGFLAGVNRWGIGQHNFYAVLRNALGPDRLIMADGTEPHSQRAVDLLNGMEAEGFAGPNLDPYLAEWSSNPNRLHYWKLNRSQPYEFNYVAHKDVKLATTPFNLTRLVFAATHALGLGITSVEEPTQDTGEFIGIWDELRQGTDDVIHWLGQPRGPMLRLAADAADLLGGAGTAMTNDFANTWTSSNAGIVKNGATLDISNNSGGDSLTISLPLASLSPSVALPPGDLFFRFEVIADPLTGWDPDVPRQLTVTADNRFSPGAIDPPTIADELHAHAGQPHFAEVAFYYRDAGPSANIIINIEIEGIEDFSIRNFTIHNAPDLMAREFDNGVVLANPALTAHSFDLASLFPGRAFRRLQGRANQDPITNDGTAVVSPISIPARDGLFLLKTADIPKTHPPILMTDFTIDTTTLRPKWTSVTGRRYQIEYSLDLVDWFKVGSPYEALGNTQSATLPLSLFTGESHVFLRVRAL